jgi:two-component system, NtrC family, sensor kinase
MIALVHSSTKVHGIPDLVVWKVTRIVQAKGTLLRIFNVEADQFELGAAYGLSEQYLSKAPVTNTISEACREKQVILIDDILLDPRIQYPEETCFVVEIPVSNGKPPRTNGKSHPDGIRQCSELFSNPSQL